MVYIHVKKVGDKKYYTLRVSARDKAGKIITKDIENLGSDISKINIETLEKKYKKEIRESYKTIKQFLESNYYIEKIKKQKLRKDDFFEISTSTEIEAIKLHFKEKFLKLDKATQNDIYKLFLIKFAVSSTSIEGNTITLKQAAKLLTENIMPKGKTAREVYDLQNTQAVFFELLEAMPEIALDMIEETHDKLLDKIDLRKGYRTHDIHILGQPFKPSPARYVKADMKLLLDWYNKNEKSMHPLALAIFFHHKFESIHPFSDGNGRTGRVLMNLILIKHKYPPLIVPMTKREEYLQAMNDADKAREKSLLGTNIADYHKLFDFIINEYRKTYWNTFLV
ncbi:Fic family protein [Candidatus Woesearchaeota archaeon]|nr:Fic family protein [Candidatus Woesearchaeota archaeon]